MPSVERCPMLSREEFIEAIVGEVAPVIAEKAGSGAQAAIEEYRQYAEQKYGKSYDKIMAKLDALATSVVAKATAADCRAVQAMDFSDLALEDEPVAEEVAGDAVYEAPEEDFAAAPVVVDDDDLEDFIDDDLDEPEEEPAYELLAEPETLEEAGPLDEPFDEVELEDEDAGFDGFADDDLDDIAALSVDALDGDEDLDGIVELPAATPGPEEFDAFAAAFADFEDDDLSDEVDEFEGMDEVLDGIAGEVMSKDEADDIDIEAGNNASIPLSALYAFEDAGDAVRYPEDPAMDWLSVTSNETFKFVKPIIDGGPRIDDDATYEQVSDTLHRATFDVKEENKDLANTMSMETALDLMFVYGKTDNLSIRGQLYQTRSMPLAQRKEVLAERIAHDTGRSLAVNIAPKFEEGEAAEMEELCERYAKVKVDTMFEKIGESNLDVLDDLRRVLMEREPERFADKGSAYIRKYMTAYIDRYGA